MAFGFSKTRYSPIAIDFGADSIKLLQVIPSDPPQLIAAAAAVVPEQARNNTQQREAFIENALKQMLRNHPFKGRQAVCSIPAFQTLVHTFELPRVEGVTIEQQVGDQLLERMQINPARMVIRHVVAGDSLASGSPRQQVICFAVRHDAVMKQIELARRCKLDIVGMHTEPKALLQAFAHLHPSATDKASRCFVDIGAATSKVVIAYGPKMLLAKTIYAGADALIREHANAHGMTFTEARQARMAQAGQVAVNHAGQADESHKHNMDATAHAAYVRANKRYGTSSMAMAGAGEPVAAHAEHHAGFSGIDVPDRGDATDDAAHSAGLDGLYDEQETACGNDVGEQPSVAQSDTMDCLIDELQLSLRYHQRVFPDRPVERLIFVGGESRNVALCQHLARSVGVMAQLGDPFSRVSRVGALGTSAAVTMDQPQPGWVVPLGLCMISET